MSGKGFKYFEQGRNKVSSVLKIITVIWLCSSEGKMRTVEKCLSHPAVRNERDLCVTEGSVWQTGGVWLLSFVTQRFESQVRGSVTIHRFTVTSSSGIRLFPSLDTRWNPKFLIWDWFLWNVVHIPGSCQRQQWGNRRINSVISISVPHI